MVEIIGIVTMVGLVWLLDSTMANESEAEQRRLSGASLTTDGDGRQRPGKGKRVAA